MASPQTVALFEEARTNFLKSLSEKDRSTVESCVSPDALMTALKDLEPSSKRIRSRGRLFKKISTFAERLQPYFKIIEIFCGAHPEYANLVWGSTRLVFQLATNFSSFFEKLCGLLESICSTLEHFQDAFETLTNAGSPRLTDAVKLRIGHALLQFYVALLEFFHDLTKIFHRTDGTRKRPFSTIAGLLWRPFDNRFAVFLDKFRVCQEVVQREINLAILKKVVGNDSAAPGVHGIPQTSQELNKILITLSEIRDNFDEVRQDLYSASILRWVSPPPYKVLWEKAMETKVDGTSEWLFAEAQYNLWLKSPGHSKSSGTALKGMSNMLWIHGKPGSGKTVVAASVVDKLQYDHGTANDNESSLVCYYFFDGAGSHPGSRLDAYRALVLQIFQHFQGSEDINDAFSLVTGGTKSVKSSATEGELLDLIRFCAAATDKIRVVLDGLDECEDSFKIFKDMRLLSRDTDTKILLFSRPHLNFILDAKPAIPSIGMRRESVDKDIMEFLDEELQEFIEDSLLPQQVDLTSIKCELVRRADGMFLWARLMIKYLSSPALTPSARLKAIHESTPDGIDDMYSKIIHFLGTLVRPTQEFARRVFTWSLYGHSSLTSDQLRDALHDTMSNPAEDSGDFDIDRAVVVSCCGLVEKRPDQTYEFMHLTARAFMSSCNLKSSLGIRLVPPRIEALCEITALCFHYLIYKVPLQPLSGRMGRSLPVGELKHHYPMLTYVATRWSLHLHQLLLEADCKAEFENAMRNVISLFKNFLSRQCNVMIWLEALFTIRSSLFSTINALKLIQSIDNEFLRSSERATLVQDVKEFSRDLHKLDQEWGNTLIHQPHEIWGDVTVFMASRFLLKTAAATLTTLRNPETPPAGDLTFNQVCFSLSASSLDATFLAILSIYPSRSFGALWTYPLNGPHRDDVTMDSTSTIRSPLIEHGLAYYCQGWMARYELHNTESTDINKRILAIDFPISELEIEIQLRQSYRELQFQGMTKTFPSTRKLTFPLSISPDLKSLVVLRSIYMLSPAVPTEGSSGPKLLGPSVLKIDNRANSSYTWSVERPLFEMSYNYATAITCDNTFLVFLDRDPLSSRDMEHSIGVFELNPGLTGAAPKYICQWQYEDSNGQPWALHHTLPRLVFAASRKIYVWNLDEVPDGPDLLYELPPKGESVTDLCQQIGLSDCGNYVTVRTAGKDLPEVFPIPSNAKSANKRLLRVESDEMEKPQLKRGRLDTHRQVVAQSLTDFVATLPATLRNTNVTSASLNHSVIQPGRHSLELVHADGHKRAKVLTLPDSVKYQDVQPLVKSQSSSHKDSITVVLNRSRPRTYDAENVLTEQRLPLLIHRNVASLQYTDDGRVTPVLASAHDDAQQSVDLATRTLSQLPEQHPEAGS